jgi:parallel beta-helix repeat protein
VTSGLSVAKSGDEVWVAKGVYAENSISPGANIALYGGFAGTETERGQRNWKANATALDGGGSHQTLVACRYPGLVLDGCSFRNAGVAVNVDSGGEATVANDVFTGNQAGINIDQGTATLAGCTFSDNDYGVYATGTVSLDSSAVSANRFDGVSVFYGEAHLANNTISGNGAGVRVVGIASLTGNSITGNGSDGVIVNSGATTFVNNIIAFNAGFGVRGDGEAQVAAFSYNDVYGNSAGPDSGFSPASRHDNLQVDPKLSNPYRNVHIQPDSPCRNAGSTAAAVGSADVDGQPRIQDGAVDIGADESDGTAWTVSLVIVLVSPDGDDAHDGLTWGTAKRTVAAALAIAPGSVEAWVAKGIYAGPVSVGAGEALYGGFAGTETERGQRDWSINPTVLDGGGGNVAAVHCGGPNVTVDGFTVRNGLWGVETSPGTLSLAHNVIRDNERAGVWAFGTTIVAGCVVADNGGVGISVKGSATLSSNAVFGNGDHGIDLSGNATVTHNSVSGNARYGVSGSDGSFILTDNYISDNGMSGAFFYYGTVTLTNNALTGNGEAGAYIYPDCTATLTNNEITGSFGDGVYVSSRSAATLVNNTISGSGASGVNVAGGAATLINNTVCGNNGSGVDLDTGAVSLTNNIVASNVLFGVRRVRGDIPVFSHNDVYGHGQPDFAGFTPPADQGNFSLNPKLTSLYHDIHIQPDSPCRDAGSNVPLIGAADIDGQPRVQGAGVDIGSDESDGVTWNVPPSILHVAPFGNDIADGLTWARAKRTVRSALLSTLGAREVWVAAGIYAGDITLDAGTALFGGFAGTESERSQRNWAANPTVLDGGGNNVASCPAGRAVVDGFTLQNGRNGVAVSLGATTVANCDISGMSECGALIHADAATVIHCAISGCKQGVHVQYGMPTLDSNAISGCVEGARIGTRGWAILVGNAISGNGTGVITNGGPTLTNNAVFHNTGPGISVESGGLSLFSNAIWANGGDGLLVSGQADLTNDTVCGNGRDGIHATGPYTMVNSANSIVAFNARYGLFTESNPGNLKFTHNAVFGNAAGDYQGFTPPADQGNINLDPLFIDRANGNFRLQTGSPCIDAGDDLAASIGAVDADGKPRVSGLQVDIGAYEYDAATAPFTPADVKRALGIASGLIAASAGDTARLNVGASGAGIDMGDAVSIARKTAGLDANL